MHGLFSLVVVIVVGTVVSFAVIILLIVVALGIIMSREFVLILFTPPCLSFVVRRLDTQKKIKLFLMKVQELLDESNVCYVHTCVC